MRAHRRTDYIVDIIGRKRNIPSTRICTCINTRHRNAVSGYYILTGNIEVCKVGSSVVNFVGVADNRYYPRFYISAVTVGNVVRGGTAFYRISISVYRVIGILRKHGITVVQNEIIVGGVRSSDSKHEFPTAGVHILEFACHVDRRAYDYAVGFFILIVHYLNVFSRVIESRIRSGFIVFFRPRRSAFRGKSDFALRYFQSDGIRNLRVFRESVAARYRSRRVGVPNLYIVRTRILYDGKIIGRVSVVSVFDGVYADFNDSAIAHSRRLGQAVFYGIVRTFIR